MISSNLIKDIFNNISKSILLIIFATPLTTISQTTIISNDTQTIEQIVNLIDGKNYWYHTTSAFPDYCKKVDFFERGKKLRIDFLNPLTFKFYKDGSVLKAKINDLIDTTVNPDTLEKDMFVYSTDEQYLNICFSDIEPIEHHKKIIQIEKKKEALASKNKKGGVRIGMTAKQVREKTDWGQPESINVTITSYGTREQWVYGYGNYLYFRNGVLESIQVRK